MTIEALVGFVLVPSLILPGQGSSYVNSSHELPNLYIRNIIPEDMSIPSPASLAYRGVAALAARTSQ